VPSGQPVVPDGSALVRLFPIAIHSSIPPEDSEKEKKPEVSVLAQQGGGWPAVLVKLPVARSSDAWCSGPARWSLKGACCEALALEAIESPTIAKRNRVFMVKLLELHQVRCGVPRTILDQGTQIPTRGGAASLG
jgi:hypothetical protein